MNVDPIATWLKGSARSSIDEYPSVEKQIGSSGPGIIGQPRQTSKAGQSGAKKHLTLAEIRSMSLPKATEALLTGNALTNLLKYKEKTPANISMLKARGFVDAPEHAIDTRPNGNDSFFDSTWAAQIPPRFERGSSRFSSSFK